MSTEEDELIRVHARIEDAGVLADKGRLEGALVMLLVAVAATSRKRYPRGSISKKDPSKKMGDREAFTTFLRDEMWRLVKEHDDTVMFRGRRRRFEDFLYEFLRNELVHGGGVPVDLQPMCNGALLTIDSPGGRCVSFSKLLLARLNEVVWRAPENSFEAVKPETDELKRRRLRLKKAASHPSPR